MPGRSRYRKRAKAYKRRRKTLVKSVKVLRRRVNDLYKGDVGVLFGNDLAQSSSNLIASDHSQNIESTTGNALVRITQIAQGDQMYQRQGNFVKLKRLRIRGVMTNLVGLSQPSPQLYRIIVFNVKSCGTSAIGVGPSDLTGALAQYTSGGMSTNLSFYRPGIQPNRIQVLWDKVFNPWTEATTTSAHVFKQIQWKCNLNLAKKIRTPCSFLGAGVTDGDCNQIFIAFFQQPTITVGNGAARTYWNFKLTYVQ